VIAFKIIFGWYATIKEWNAFILPDIPTQCMMDKKRKSQPSSDHQPEVSLQETFIQFVHFVKVSFAEIKDYNS
jgi:hypothetical protein